MSKHKVDLIELFVVTTIFIGLLSTLSNHSVIAAINESFNYQGKIVNTDGTNLKNVDAACVNEGGADLCDFRINIYTLSSGGTLVWQETKSDVEIYDNDGIFNLTLDCSGTFSNCNQNGGPDLTSGQLFIEVEFDTSGNGDFSEGETFNPRRVLSAVPYSFNSKTSDNANLLDNIDSTSLLRSDASDTFNNGYTLTMDGTFDVNGDISIDDTTVIFDGPTTEFSMTGDLSINLDDLFVEKNSGYVGINNNNPGVELDVSGIISASSDIRVGNDLIVGGISLATADIYLGSSGVVIINGQSNDSDFRIDGSGPNLKNIFFADANTGSIGIDTSAPTAFIDLPSSTTTRATARLRTGVQPSAPNVGDIYADGTGFYYRNNSSQWIDLSAGSSLQSTYNGGATIDISSTEGALTFDAGSANLDVLVGQNSDTGDFRVWDGTNNWFMIDENVNTISLGNNQAATALSLTGGTTWSLASTGALSGITTISSSGDWTFSATTPTITINNNETFTVTDGSDSFAVNTSGTSFGMTSASSTVTFDMDTGPAFTGNARPTKKITLSPEYTGAILTPFYGAEQDTNISGTMTSDSDTAPATSIKTYYNWQRNASTQHFYTVAVRITLPPDFSAWATATNAVTMGYKTASTTSTNSLVDARVYMEGDATLDASSSGQTSLSWSTINFTSADLDIWNAAGETGVIYLRLGSQSSNWARIGDITLTYLASY
ncbi:hypothetical protein A2V49_03380 [candidate division WWE3 bacterium RBG_19FT_COMBO_34_6]|uniref:Uncharacterized protein n=1 Tax=candidate division WWE3 bacterium RBG_19FT_COMBO_34_6 TaxID=1802612 RepID=A0A1F4UKR5_UNCKA|nr:MAG: hypothetical protein A2V49_03380 [candidate division WWE3 bacterium RBG_19FT_COMBO_34_6]